jgi:hypothetical protein
MIYKLATQQPNIVCVVFELPSCVWADQILVSGTFNQWDQRSIPMHQDRDGVWRARVELCAGQRYEFRYLIDGRWQTDYHADGFADNEFGTHNSIVDLTQVTTLQLTPSAQVSDGHVAVAPHLPAPSETAASLTRLPRSHSPVEMPRMRPRVAAA